MDMRAGKVFLDLKTIQKNCNMKNVIYLVLFVLFSCNKQENKIINSEKQTANNTVKIEKDLDQILVCDNFDIRDGYYQIPDYGCTYDNKINKLGNANVIIIPKTEKFQTNLIESHCLDDMDCLKDVYKNISSLTMKEFKNNFNAIIFIIDKRFLKKTPSLDQAFNAEMPYIIDTYILQDGEWKEGFQYKVNNDNDLAKMKDWEEKYLRELVNPSISTTKDASLLEVSDIDKKWIGNYSVKLNYGETQGLYSGLTIKIMIKKDSILASGEGYQIGFKDLLSANNDGNKLIFNQLKNLEGNDLGSTMKPEFILIEQGGKYYIQSEWIDSDFVNKKNNLGYEIEKK